MTEAHSYDKTILGWMTEHELSILEKIAETVPDDGIIVELGSMFGRSAVCFASSCKSTVVVKCIDSFAEYHVPIHDIPKEVCIDNHFPIANESYELRKMFIENTKQFNNIQMIQGFSPSEIHYTDEHNIDVFFLDGMHYNPNDWDNLCYFVPKIKIGGLICGHDYNSLYFPDVVLNVQRLEHLLNVKATIYSNTSIWSLPMSRKISEIEMQNFVTS